MWTFRALENIVWKIICTVIWNVPRAHITTESSQIGVIYGKWKTFVNILPFQDIVIASYYNNNIQSRWCKLRFTLSAYVRITLDTLWVINMNYVILVCLAKQFETLNAPLDSLNCVPLERITMGRNAYILTLLPYSISIFSYSIYANKSVMSN